MVCLSTAEAEWVAAVEAIKSTMWIRDLVGYLLRRTMPAISVFEDNQSCIRMAENPVISPRNRHFAMRMHWLRDLVTDKAVSFPHVPTDQQLADIFPKALPIARFRTLRDAIVPPNT